MSLSVYAFTCGWLTLPAALLPAGEKGSLTVPVPAYLIEHPKGRAIFDSGLHVETQTDPNRRLGRLATYHTVGFKPGEEIGARLESLGVAPSKIDFIINSHLHFDHCGGNQQLPNATLLIQRREWEAGHSAELIESVYYDPHDYDHGHRVKMIDGEHDVFGDGSVVCIPTPGHTPGHQSLRVRIGADEVVMTGDACYRSSQWCHHSGSDSGCVLCSSRARFIAAAQRGLDTGTAAWLASACATFCGQSKQSPLLGMSTTSRSKRICVLGAGCSICPIIAGFLTPLAVVPSDCVDVAWLPGAAPPAVRVLVGTCARAGTRHKINAAIAATDRQDHFKGYPPFNIEIATLEQVSLRLLTKVFSTAEHRKRAFMITNGHTMPTVRHPSQPGAQKRLNSRTGAPGDRADQRDRKRHASNDADQHDQLRDRVRGRLLTLRNRLLDVRGMRPRMVSAVRCIVDAGARDADRLANSLGSERHVRAAHPDRQTRTRFRNVDR